MREWGREGRHCRPQSARDGHSFQCGAVQTRCNTHTRECVVATAMCPTVTFGNCRHNRLSSATAGAAAMHAFRFPVPSLSSAGAPRRFKAAVASHGTKSVSAGKRLRALRVECNELNKWCVPRATPACGAAPGASQGRGEPPARAWAPSGPFTARRFLRVGTPLGGPNDRRSLSPAPRCR